mmetsp:Transcript_35189/g.80279  ORF Transcript_35189/g.80279 Transcript_35189/m.80279 type:complete len:215 (+) Transcript_35189:317-961(+)
MSFTQPSPVPVPALTCVSIAALTEDSSKVETRAPYGLGSSPFFFFFLSLLRAAFLAALISSSVRRDRNTTSCCSPSESLSSEAKERVVFSVSTEAIRTVRCFCARAESHSGVSFAPLPTTRTHALRRRQCLAKSLSELMLWTFGWLALTTQLTMVVTLAMSVARGRTGASPLANTKNNGAFFPGNSLSWKPKRWKKFFPEGSGSKQERAPARIP